MTTRNLKSVSHTSPAEGLRGVEERREESYKAPELYVIGRTKDIVQGYSGRNYDGVGLRRTDHN